MLKVAQENGLRFQWTKCKYMSREVKFLGHIICDGTLKPSTEKLKSKIRGESTEALAAKLTAAKQGNKTVNTYAKDIEDLAKALNNSYLLDGLTSELKALISNATNPEVRIVMRAGQFSSINDVVENS